jgi:hypothetical protein
MAKKSKPPTLPTRFEDGPLARTRAQILAGPVCAVCGRSTHRGGHECPRRQS